MALFKKMKKSLKGRPSLDIQKEVVRGLTTAKLLSMMEESGITKADLARELGVSKAAVTGWLRGNRNFTIDTLTQIARVFGKTPRIEFLSLDENQAGEETSDWYLSRTC